MQYDNYDDDMEVDIEMTDTDRFLSRMLLSTLFRRLPEEFTYKEFEKIFARTFLVKDADYAKDAFISSLGLELIDLVENTETYRFNGIAMPTTEDN